MRRRSIALVSVSLITFLAAGATWQFLPNKDFLPDGSRNLILGFIVPPPGYNVATNTELATRLESRTKPLWASETGPDSAPGAPPKLRDFYFVTFSANTIIVARSVEPERVKELIPVLQGPVFEEPGMFGVFKNRSIFGRGFGGSRTINLDIYDGTLEDLVAVASRAAGKVGVALPRSENHQMRPKPGLSLGAPEVRVVPDRGRLADARVSALELGQTIDVYNDGLRVAEPTIAGKRMNLILRGPVDNIVQTQGIEYLPVVTSDGTILPAGELASINVTSGPTQIRHTDRSRAITLEIATDESLPLEEAIEIVRNEVIAPLMAEGVPPGVKFKLSGSADELQKTWDHMSLDLIVAIVIVFLVMAVLFESFIYPLVILLSVPLATAGGVIGLAILNMFVLQNLDMLTMLGFVILIGIVVNNAILLVHQSLFHIRQEGMEVAAAVVEATRNRVRPIFMSTLTSVFGMFPLVLFPGAGSELYRGLGSVVLGGLSLSAVLTLLIVPPLVAVLVGPLERRRAARRQALAAQPAE